MLIVGYKSYEIALNFSSLLSGHLQPSPDAPPLFNLADVLPNGRCEIEQMEIRFSDRANDLMVKMQSAIATNKDWFLEQIKQAKPGEPLAYDARLAILSRKEEYAEYLKAAENRHLASTGTRLSACFAGRVTSFPLILGTPTPH